MNLCPLNGFLFNAFPALSGSGLFLTADTTTKLHLSGRIVPQSGSDLDVIGELFSNFLAGENQTLNVVGQSVQPSGSSRPVSWLTTAFMSLTLNVTLPGERFTVGIYCTNGLQHNLSPKQIIQSIAISDLEVEMVSQDEAFAPPTSSKFTLAQYKNPFGFSLQVIESGENITITNAGADVAEVGSALDNLYNRSLTALPFS